VWSGGRVKSDLRPELAVKPFGIHLRWVKMMHDRESFPTITYPQPVDINRLHLDHVLRARGRGNFTAG